MYNRQCKIDFLLKYVKNKSNINNQLCKNNNDNGISKK